MNFRNTAMMVTLAIVVLTCLGGVAGGQEPEQQPTTKPANQSSQPGNTYLLEFTLREIDGGKKVNARSYLMRAQSGGIMNKIRAGSRVPITTGVVQDPKLTQFQYLDVGMSIDCRVEELGRDVLLDFVVDFSSLAPDQASNPALGGQPVIGSVRTQTHTIVELGKPTLLSRTDDPGSKRTFELDVTVTKLH